MEKNTKKEKRLSRTSRQKVSQMETGTIKRLLAYKAKEVGISTRFVGERNTSKECPVCGAIKPPEGQDIPVQRMRVRGSSRRQGGVHDDQEEAP